MYPWYRDSQIGVGQFCSPMAATIKTESGYNDCMLALDYAAQTKVCKYSYIFWLQNSNVAATAKVSVACYSFP